MEHIGPPLFAHELGQNNGKHLTAGHLFLYFIHMPQKDIVGIAQVRNFGDKARTWNVQRLKLTPELFLSAVA